MTQYKHKHSQNVLMIRVWSRSPLAPDRDWLRIPSPPTRSLSLYRSSQADHTRTPVQKNIYTWTHPQPQPNSPRSVPAPQTRRRRSRFARVRRSNSSSLSSSSSHQSFRTRLASFVVKDKETLACLNSSAPFLFFLLPRTNNRIPHLAAMQGGPILPRRPRSSALGLDVLAKRKREAQGSDAIRPRPHKEEVAAVHRSGEIARADCRRRWEWEDTPRREYRDDPPASQRQHPAPSPWDNVYSLPSAPVRPSGSSKGPSSSCNDTEARTRPPTADRKFKVTEEMMQEMDYNADRTWYGCEEHSSIQCR